MNGRPEGLIPQAFVTGRPQGEFWAVLAGLLNRHLECILCGVPLPGCGGLFGGGGSGGSGMTGAGAPPFQADEERANQKINLERGIVPGRAKPSDYSGPHPTRKFLSLSPDGPA